MKANIFFILSIILIIEVDILWAILFPLDNFTIFPFFTLSIISSIFIGIIGSRIWSSLLIDNYFNDKIINERNKFL